MENVEKVRVLIQLLFNKDIDSELSTQEIEIVKNKLIELIQTF